MNETEHLLNKILERIEERYTEEMRTFGLMRDLLGKERSGSSDIIREIREDNQHSIAKEPETSVSDKPKLNHEPTCRCATCWP